MILLLIMERPNKKNVPLETFVTIEAGPVNGGDTRHVKPLSQIYVMMCVYPDYLANLIRHYISGRQQTCRSPGSYMKWMFPKLAEPQENSCSSNRDSPAVTST